MNKKFLTILSLGLIMSVPALAAENRSNAGASQGKIHCEANRIKTSDTASVEGGSPSKSTKAISASGGTQQTKNR